MKSQNTSSEMIIKDKSNNLYYYPICDDIPILGIIYKTHNYPNIKPYSIGSLQLSSNCYTKYLEVPIKIPKNNYDVMLSCTMIDKFGELTPNRTFDVFYNHNGDIDRIRFDGLQIIAANPPDDKAPMCVVNDMGDISVTPITVEKFKEFYTQECAGGIRPKKIEDIYGNGLTTTSFENLLMLAYNDPKDKVLKQSAYSNLDDIFRMTFNTVPESDVDLTGDYVNTNKCMSSCEIF